jgi:hypothetical protein
MRVSRLWTLAILGAVCSVQAADPPKQKPGLWQMTTVQNGAPEQTLKVCIDEKTGDFYLGAQEMQKACSKLETHVTGSTVTRDAVCKFGQTQVTTHGVTTFQGDSAYRAEAHSHWDPPMAGRSDTSSTITGKWLAASCGAGMRPGDVMMSNGKIISPPTPPKPH